MTATQTGFRVIGRATPKLDAEAKVTGAALFGADVRLPNALTAKILRSPYAHAVIRRIDKDAAEAHPGVHAVIDGSDLPGPVPGDFSKDGAAARTILARGRVFFHGQAVAAVAAESEEAAEEALDLIDVEYEVLPHVLDPVEAMRPGARVLHTDLIPEGPVDRDAVSGNVAEHLVYERGDVQEGFVDADLIVEREFKTQVVHQGYVEPDSEAAWAHPDGRIEVWANTQGIFDVRKDLARALDMPIEDITVKPTEVGGAFGGKESVRLSAVCAALSQRAGRPVEGELTREEVIRSTGPGNATVSNIRLGVKRDGTVTAISAQLIFDAGAFPGAPLRSALRRVYSHYWTPNLRVDGFDVVTNKPHVSYYRAPGATPTAFALESVVDEAAERLGIDPLEFRLKNVSRPGDPMPDGVTLPSVNLATLLEQVRTHPCWTDPVEEGEGRGLAVGMWTMPGGTTSCRLDLASDGTVNLVLGTVDLSGTRTSLAMVAAEALGLDLEDVNVVMGDTDTATFSESSGADKVTYVTSKAVYEAAQELMGKLKSLAASEFGVPMESVEFEGKRLTVDSAPESGMTLAEAAARAAQDETPLFGAGRVTEVTDSVAIAPNAAVHVARVRVDKETGKVDVTRYAALQDVGLSVNPDQVEGQIQGGATQGLGWALSEEYVFSADGVVENATLLDYRLPTALDVPFFETVVVEAPSDDHPYGVRAVGQVPIVPPAAAVGNAVYDAVGVRLNELPMNPERVFRAIEAAAE